jgi:small subunit ribosomal protein S21
LSVQLRRGESVDSLLRRFRKSVAASGVLGQIRRKRWHVSKGELRRMKKKKGIRKAKRKQRQHDQRDVR